MILVADSNQRIHATVAQTLWQRTRGLLGRPCPAKGHGLLIERCHAVHTVGMAYPIDVVFLDRFFSIVRIATVPPMRLYACCGRRAHHTLEMAEGEAVRLGLREREQLVRLPAA